MKSNKLTFEFLEKSLTKEQLALSKWLLLYCMEKTVRYNSNKENKQKRQQIFDDYKQKIMPNFEYSSDFHALVKKWWTDETKWYNKHSQKYTHKQLIDGLFYRTLAIFFRNHSLCPFINEDQKPDEEFHVNHQKLFKKFLNQSMTHIRTQSDILYRLRRAKSININESIKSAENELHDREWKFLKGLAIGGAVGVATSIFLGPVIGGWIGNMAGLSGAAATSFGLALLGGGSLASGGFGMFGGSIMLGTLFGVAGGVKEGLKKSSVNEIDVLQAGQLPVILAIGRCMYSEAGNIEIPCLIHKTISKKLKELKTRSERASKQKTKKDLKNLIGIYEKAYEMSKTEGWVYDDNECKNVA